MTILALDSAAKSAGVCLLRDGKVLYRAALGAAFTHSETLLALIDTALRAVRLTLADVDVLAAAAGPGSFTGLRIGLSLMKGLALAQNKPCMCAPTLEALALSPGAQGVVAAAMDARRGEVYCAAFRVRGGEAERLLPDAAMSAADFAAALDALGEPCVCMGDGAHLVCAHTASCRPVFEPLRTDCSLGAALIAQREAEAGRCIPGGACVPDYQRLSQAQRERAAREAANNSNTKES